MRKRYFIAWNSNSGKWQLKGKSRTIRTFSTKEEALKYARSFVKKNTPSQLVVKKKDGKIQKEWTYGNDPYPPKG